MPPTRVKYDLLPEGAHTFVYADDTSQIDPVDGMYPAADVKEVRHNAIVEVEDLNDPKSRRAHGVRQHLEGIGKPGQSGSQPPLCTLLEDKPSKKASAERPAPSKS